MTTKKAKTKTRTKKPTMTIEEAHKTMEATIEKLGKAGVQFIFLGAMSVNKEDGASFCGVNGDGNILKPLAATSFAMMALDEDNQASDLIFDTLRDVGNKLDNPLVGVLRVLRASSEQGGGKRKKSA